MWTIKEIIKILQGKPFNIEDSHISIEKISTDTRTLKKNAGFIALKGAHFDAHDFVHKAIENGARVCIVEKKMEVPCIVVSDTLKSLGVLAREWRKNFKISVIALTGSNGKTSTKEFIARVLSQKYKTHKTQGNLNN